MYIFTETKPDRDGSFDNDIPMHEYTHGISTRLTGGPSNSDCLQDGEAGGMGEGWSDYFAIMGQVTKENPHPDFAMGSYVVNNPAGIRR